MFKPGELTAAEARRLNELERKVEALSRMTAAAPLSITRNAGIPSIRVNSALASPWKPVVRAASTANVTLATGVEAGDTLDGVTLVVGDRILLKDQTAGAENGIYTVSASGAPNRTTDADDGDDLVGATVWVSEGTANGNTAWACTTDAPITLETTALVWLNVYPATASVSSWKTPVRVATTATGTLASAYENGDTVDGVTLATGDRILIKNQSTGGENGIYTVNASGAPTRATDCDAAAEFIGATVFVSEGTTNADTVWICTTNATITVGTTATTWTQYYPDASTTSRGILTASTQGIGGRKNFITGITTPWVGVPYTAGTGSPTGYFQDLVLDSGADNGIGFYIDMFTYFGIGASGALYPNGTKSISGSRTVKDGSGNNQTVTITNGIITDWTV